MHAHAPPGWDQLRIHIHDHLSTLFGIEDASGVELFALLQRTAHLSELLDAQLADERELSAPRWRLLLHLLIEEKLGNDEGVTPTVLSRSQRVSKNTISALLRGLEAQGLIERTLDPTDLRAFRIRLTQAGRDYLLSTVPRRIEGLNRLFSGIGRREREELIALLEKLQGSFAALCRPPHADPAAAMAPPQSLNQEQPLQ